MMCQPCSYHLKIIENKKDKKHKWKLSFLSSFYRCGEANELVLFRFALGDAF